MPNNSKIYIFMVWIESTFSHLYHFSLRRRRCVKQYLIYWDLLRHVSEWTGCLWNDILAVPPRFLLALCQTERDDSQEMQKLSDTAHLAKAHPSTGDLTTSAPRLTWAGDKGPPVSLGRDVSLQLLSGSAIPSLPPSVLLSFYREVKVQRVCAGVWVGEAGGTENLCHSPLAVVSWQTGPGLQLCRSLWCPQVQSRPDRLNGASRPCCKYETHFILVCHAPDEDRCMFSPSCG